MEQTVVFAIVLIMLVAIVAGLVEFAIPLYVQLQFDHICRQYTLVAESENGLSTHATNAFVESLNELGIQNIGIQAPEEDLSQRGTLQTVRVEGEYVYFALKSIFKREQIAYPLHYESQFLSRKVVN